MSFARDCTVAGALIGGMLMIHLNTDRSVMGDFYQTFTPKQMMIMRHIKMMRMRIWATGLLVGLVVAYLLTPKLPSTLLRADCVFTGIALLVNYFWYMLCPKDVYMIEHLREDQVDEWLEVKKMMQRNYHLGMLVGGAGVFVLGNALFR